MNVLILLVLAGFSCQSMNARFDYEDPSCPLFKYNNICPLARYNIKVAEDLMNTVQELLEVVRGQGVDTSKAEILLLEAEEMLGSAREYSQSCITSNTFAVHCQNLLRKCQEMLESKEVYAVYSALIKADYTEGYIMTENSEIISGTLQFIVIEDHTSRPGSVDMDLILKKLPATEQETLNNFQAKRLQQLPLADLFDLNVKVVLLSEEEDDKYFKDRDLWEGWIDFYRTYPYSQGVMALSRVGFNSEMNQALVFVWNASEPERGAGLYVLLTKKAGVWEIQEEFKLETV